MGEVVGNHLFLGCQIAHNMSTSFCCRRQHTAHVFHLVFGVDGCYDRSALVPAAGPTGAREDGVGVARGQGRRKAESGPALP